jgi:pantothenate kinase
MLVGDIYGGRDYSSIGLSATTIASSFGKVVGNDKQLEDYNKAGVRAGGAPGGEGPHTQECATAASLGPCTGCPAPSSRRLRTHATHYPPDIAMALCRMISYNIGQLAYMNAKRFGLKRVFFGGFFIRGHPYTMDTISFAIRFWSQVRARRRPGSVGRGAHAGGASRRL